MSHVYADSKVFHFPQKLLALREGRLTAPIHVRLKPTNRCNHRCSYCCYRNPDLFLGQQMVQTDEIPVPKMRRIVADMIEMGVRAVTFSGGGEPLCYGGIIETVQTLCGAGVKVAMLTNGSLLEGPAAETLARQAAWVRISMDAADADSYARSRGVNPREFDRVCGNIRRFARMAGRRCALGLNLIVTRDNSDHVLSFLRLARDLGVNHVKVSGVVVSTRPDENDRYLEPLMRRVKDQIAAAQAELADETFSVIDKVHLSHGRESFTRRYSRCPFAECLTVIGADLSVYCCQDKAYTAGGLLGSLREQDFRAMWLSEATARSIRSIDPSTRCGHHCVAHAKNLLLLDYIQADQQHLDFV